MMDNINWLYKRWLSRIIYGVDFFLNILIVLFFLSRSTDQQRFQNLQPKMFELVFWLVLRDIQKQSWWSTFLILKKKEVKAFMLRNLCGWIEEMLTGSSSILFTCES